MSMKMTEKIFVSCQHTDKNVFPFYYFHSDVKNVFLLFLYFFLKKKKVDTLGVFE